MAGMTTSPQLRESPDTMKRQEPGGRGVIAAVVPVSLATVPGVCAPAEYVPAAQASSASPKSVLTTGSLPSDHMEVSLGARKSESHALCHLCNSAEPLMFPEKLSCIVQHGGGPQSLWHLRHRDEPFHRHRSARHGHAYSDTKAMSCQPGDRSQNLSHLGRVSRRSRQSRFLDDVLVLGEHFQHVLVGVLPVDPAFIHLFQPAMKILSRLTKVRTRGQLRSLSENLSIAFIGVLADEKFPSKHRVWRRSFRHRRVRQNPPPGGTFKFGIPSIGENFFPQNTPAA